MFHALTDSALEAEIMTEISSSQGTDTQEAPNSNGKIQNLDIPALSKCSLLQSVYAEVLRLYNAIAFTRVSEDKDFDLDGHIIKAGTPMVLLSRPSAMNEEVWAQAGRASQVPLSRFSADRFLVGGEGRRTSQTRASRDDGRSFSLDGLAGIWTPFGGGHWLCPGRHFAKNEILATVALLFSRFEMQILTENKVGVQPDMWWYPVGGLPPNKKVPFRIRQKSSL